MLKHLPVTFLALCLCGTAVTFAADNPPSPRVIRAPIAAGPELKEKPDEASRRAAAETSAAIRAIGPNPSTMEIYAIVSKAVRSSPGSVLAIVHAATLASPLGAAPDIVNAAASALANPRRQVLKAAGSFSGSVQVPVHSATLAPPIHAAPDIVAVAASAPPTPWRQVFYRRLFSGPVKRSKPDLIEGLGQRKSPAVDVPRPDGDRAGRDPGANAGDGTSSHAGANPGTRANSTYGPTSGYWPTWTYGPTPGYGGNLSYGPCFGSGSGSPSGPGADAAYGKQMSLAEAIIQVAFDARPGLSSQSLQAAVDTALLTDNSLRALDSSNPNRFNS